MREWDGTFDSRDFQVSLLNQTKPWDSTILACSVMADQFTKSKEMI